jgi:hypothetical protein
VAAELIVTVIVLAGWWMNLRALLQYVEMRYDHELDMQASRRHRCDGTCTGTVTRLVK